jgi:hypothetical protein
MYTLVATSADNGNQYQAVFTGGDWVVTNPATLTVVNGLAVATTSRRSGEAGASRGARPRASSRREYRLNRTAGSGTPCLNPPLRPTSLPFAFARRCTGRE